MSFVSPGFGPPAITSDRICQVLGSYLVSAPCLTGKRPGQLKRHRHWASDLGPEDCPFPFLQILVAARLLPKKAETSSTHPMQSKTGVGGSYSAVWLKQGHATFAVLVQESFESVRHVISGPNPDFSPAFPQPVCRLNSRDSNCCGHKRCLPRAPRQ